MQRVSYENKLLHIDMIELINRGCAEILFEADGEYLLRGHGLKGMLSYKTG